MKSRSTLDTDANIGQCAVSDRNLTFIVLIRQNTRFDGEVKVCPLPQQLIGSDIIVRQTNFDVTIGQYVVPDRILACATVVRHKTLSDGEVKVGLLP